eukprot:4063750-Karenia_brevis.AAC.1
MEQVMVQLMPQMRPQYESRKETVEDKGKVVLDEKHFGMEKYSGDASQCRMWIFHLKVALGQVDSNLAKEISQVLIREDVSRFPSDWDPKDD